jgi:hypothetical protein
MSYQVNLSGSDADERDALMMIRKRKLDDADPKRQAELALDRIARKRASASGETFHRAYATVLGEEPVLYDISKRGADAITARYGSVEEEVARLKTLG